MEVVIGDTPLPMADVLDLAPLIERKQHDYHEPICRHIKVYVSAEKRIVECRSCNAVLDPIDYLLKLAMDDAMRRQWKERIEKMREQTSVHAPGVGADLLRCKASPGGRWTVQITNKPEAVTCRQCRAR